MRIGFAIVLLAGALTACSSAKDQAAAECDKQKAALPASVDGEQFCECLTSKISDDASVSEAEEILKASASTCVSEQLQNVLQGLGGEQPAAPAPAE